MHEPAAAEKLAVRVKGEANIQERPIAMASAHIVPWIQGGYMSAAISNR